MFLRLSLSTLIALAAPINSDASDELAPYMITARDANSRIWERVLYTTNELGEVSAQTNSFTELETGVCRLQNREWVDASEEIQITPDGATAQKTRHRINFSANCNTSIAVELIDASGKLFQSHVIGISYLDRGSGQVVLINEVKDSIGQLLPSKSEVVYPDAMTDFRVDISYQNFKSGMEQNIILVGRPTDPAVFQMNKETVVMQVLTEFIAAPEPQRRQSVDRAGRLVDDVLDFGEMKVGRGRAFVGGESADSDNSIPVRKYWAHPSGRTILVEEVDYTAIEPLLNTLTASAAPSVKDSPDGVLYVVSSERLLPAVKVAKNSAQSMQLAGAPSTGKGVVLDYSILSSTNTVLKGDVTYFVTGTSSIDDLQVEGGAIVKFTNTT